MFARSLLKLAIILAGTVFVVDAGIEPVSAVPEPAAYETAWVAPEGGAKDCELDER